MSADQWAPFAGAAAVLALVCAWCWRGHIQAIWQSRDQPRAAALRREQLDEADLCAVQFRAQAEHAQALADMYELRAARLRVEEAVEEKRRAERKAAHELASARLHRTPPPPPRPPAAVPKE